MNRLSELEYIDEQIVDLLPWLEEGLVELSKPSYQTPEYAREVREAIARGVTDVFRLYARRFFQN